MKLKFHEKGKDYTENIKIDNTTVEIDVPKHAGIEEAKYLNDYEVVKLINFQMKTYIADLETADLVTFAEDIRNGKLHFLCSVTEIKIGFSK